MNDRAERNQELDRRVKARFQRECRSKLRLLAEIEGYNDPIDFLESGIIGTNYGICINPDCDYTTEVEPDSEDGWCECCEDNTVVSGMELYLNAGEEV